MEKEKKLKIKIAEAATSRYVENNRFTIQSLARQLEIEQKKIYDLFPNRSSILDFFYESRLHVYSEDLIQVAGYANFSLSEKLSNLLYHLLDQFQQHREFVILTYKDRVLGSGCRNEFQKAFLSELEKIFSDDERISTTATLLNGNLAYKCIYFHFHGFILFWMNDKSPNYENSMALSDKWCSLLEEIYYSKLIDKSFDFGKFLFYQSPFSDIINNNK